jgi:hypothetical protein
MPGHQSQSGGVVEIDQISRLLVRIPTVEIRAGNRGEAQQIPFQPGIRLEGGIVHPPVPDLVFEHPGIEPVGWVEPFGGRREGSGEESESEEKNEAESGEAAGGHHRLCFSIIPKRKTQYQRASVRGETPR